MSLLCVFIVGPTASLWVQSGAMYMDTSKSLGLSVGPCESLIIQHWVLSGSLLKSTWCRAQGWLYFTWVHAYYGGSMNESLIKINESM